MIKPIIKTVAPSNADQAVGTVVLAFSADPIARWFYPDPHDYLTNLPSFVRAFAGKAFENNSAYQINGYSGAALWLPPDVHSDEDALVALLQRSIPEEKQQDIFAFMKRMLPWKAFYSSLSYFSMWPFLMVTHRTAPIIQMTK